jgi:hypothetical protein
MATLIVICVGAVGILIPCLVVYIKDNYFTPEGEEETK